MVNLSFHISPYDVQKLMKKMNCTATDAVEALSARTGHLPFAEEYLHRKNLKWEVETEEQFPKWSQYLKDLRKEG